MGFQIGFPALKNYPPSTVTYDVDAQAMFAARALVSDEPSAAYKQAISDYVTALKAVSGLWADIIQLVVFAGATTIAGAGIAIKGLDLTNSGFVDADVHIKNGITGDATAKRFILGYGGGTISGTGQNDFHTYVYVSSIGTGVNAIYGNNTATNGAWRQSQDGSTRCRNVTVDTATATGAGGYGMNRTNSTDYERMRASTPETITRTSQTPSAGAYCLFSAAAASFSDSTILVSAMGTGITTLGGYNTPTSDFVAALAGI